MKLSMVEVTKGKILELISDGESEIVEFKTTVRNPAVLAQNLSAFANTAGGTLLVGIQEPDIVVGADEAQIRQLLERSKELLSTSVDVKVQTVLVEQKPVVAIAVKPSSELVFCKGQALGLFEIAEKTGLNKTTVKRMLVNLTQRKYLQQDPKTKKYKLGIRLFELGGIVFSSFSLRKAAAHFMDVLQKETQSTVLLGVMKERESFLLMMSWMCWKHLMNSYPCAR